MWVSPFMWVYGARVTDAAPAPPTINGAYDRAALRRSIVHIGVGGFHRAHLATYVDELCRSGETDWSIVGCGVLPGDKGMAEALQAQDGQYIMITRGLDDEGHDATSVQPIGSIVDYLHAWPENDSLVEQIASPDTQIVSLTVTEGGYPVDDASGNFLPDSPNAAAGSAFAAIAAGLAKRRTTGNAPLTVLSCDNVVGNGHITETAVRGCAEALDPSLGAWIDENVSFPNSMVDRITPATAPADRDWLLATHNINDRWPVVTEPFRQWVVEDRFAGDRLPLEKLDVIVTDDVEPYEMMKLRLLNAGHSCLAYLSALLDVATVDEAMSQIEIADFLTSFLETEARPVLPPIVGIDIDAYIASLIHRFSNPSIGDQIERLCLDGSAKLPKFLMPTVHRQIEAGGPVELSALALAGWCEYLNGTTETGQTINLASDPLLDEARAAAHASQSDPLAFLDFKPVFGDLQADSSLHKAFGHALVGLRSGGVRSTIMETLERRG